VTGTAPTMCKQTPFTKPLQSQVFILNYTLPRQPCSTGHWPVFQLFQTLTSFQEHDICN
jgi:hypothetical protein